jgi:hypothetical protein
VIDPSRARADLLADIGAPDLSGGPVHDLADARVVSGDCHLRLRGRTRADLFPWLRVALTERFSAVPRPVLIRDLLMPLKHALGNAERHGNGDDPHRTITVEVVLTSRGAFIAVTDEGDGFDVDLTVRRWQDQQTYFVHHGSGFRGLHRAASAVTWEHGGRTLLLCFRPSVAGSDVICPEPGVDERAAGTDQDPRDDPALRRLLDPAWIGACLASELSRRENGRAHIASVHAYTSRAPAGDDCGIRYVLRSANPATPGAQARIFTGRLHADEATAAADFEAATALNGGQQWKGLRIPVAVLRPVAEPRLVLYDFDPWMNLWQYLAYRGSLKALRHSASRAGEALALLHRSQGVLRGAEPDSAAARFDAVVASGQNALARLPAGADLAQRFSAGMQRIRDRRRVRREQVWAPIHGALGWNHIHYAVDGCFYFYRFEACRLSEPAIDVGGFAVDLLRFTLASNDTAAYRVCCDDLLSSYNANAPHAVHQNDIPYYIALAIGERLRDGSRGTAGDAPQLLAALDAAGAT